MSSLTKMGLIAGTFSSALIGPGIMNIDRATSGRAEAGTGNFRPVVMAAGPLNVIQLAQNSKPESKPGSKPVPPLIQEWDLKPRTFITQKLELSLTDPTQVSFQDNPLVEALNYLEDVHHIEIKIDEQALNDEGINTDIPVTLQMSGISLKSALNLILEPLGLDYIVKNEVLMITTQAKASETFETRVYDVSRLKDIPSSELEEIIYTTICPENWNPRPNQNEAANSVSRTGSVESSKQQVAPTSSASSSTTATGNTTSSSTTAQHAPAQAGSEAVTSNSRGSIKSTKRTLVIRQTQRIHDEIIDLLNQLAHAPESDHATTRTPK